MDIHKFVELCDVENNFCFLPRDGLTFCNCYAKVVLASQGVFIPNKTADELYEWLLSESGWSIVPVARSTTDAIVAIARAVPHGHIAVQVEDSIWTSAGAKNHKFATINQTFGKLVPTYFYHSK